MSGLDEDASWLLIHRHALWLGVVMTAAAGALAGFAVGLLVAS